MRAQEKISGKGMTSLRTRQRLVERLTDQGISDVRVLEVMRDTPRHLFLDEALASRAYEDLALPIGHQQTISQPYIVARMTELLIQNERLSQRPLGAVLEIGTGCGYQTAILSKFSQKVISIERIKPLHEKAKHILKDLKISNAELENLFFDSDQGFSWDHCANRLNQNSYTANRYRNAIDDLTGHHPINSRIAVILRKK